MYIGLLSDTHNYLDPKIYDHFKDVDEIWHAGDFGSIDLALELMQFKPLKGVYGNIDGTEIRKEFPKNMRFDANGLSVWMTHIGGYPGNYSLPVREELKEEPSPDLFVCGHSHILKVIFDKKHNMMCFNPGAAGKHGFHKIKTMMRFKILKGKIKDAEVIQLGYRGKIA